MTYNTYRNTQKNQAQKEAAKNDPIYGIYLGEVVSTIDTSRQGKIGVYIPSLGKRNPKGVDAEKKDQTSENGFFTCIWSRAFAGSTPESAQGENKSYINARKSYGMWSPPPDPGSTVLVCFADNNMKYPIVIGSLFPTTYTYMVPGMAAGVSFGDSEFFMPVAEKNSNDGRITHNNAIRPLHVDIAEGIVKQGLIGDALRGAGQSSSRRESPSEVFGILTPGPPDPDNPGHRKGGHQLVMDDNEGSRMMRFRTAGGNQILMDDTTGIIYMINKKGSAWIEIGADGDINLFGEGSFNLRTNGNFNLRADKNVNIEAGQNLNLKAAGDNVGGEYRGIPGLLNFTGPLGTGGTVTIEGTSNINQLAGQNILATAGGGDINLNSAGQTTVIAGTDFSADARNGATINAGVSAAIHGGARVSATSGGTADFYGSRLTLNSNAGRGAIGIAQASIKKALATSRTAPIIGTVQRKDAPPKAPDFDRQAALRGEPSLPTSGRRSGNAPILSTIVPVILTQEPYNGHEQYDALDGLLRTVSQSEQILNNLRNGANPSDPLSPASIVTPNGTSVGLGFSDTNGNPISDLQNIDENSIPNYLNLDVSGVFKAAGDVRLLEIQSLNNVVNGIRSAIPPIRFPTINSAGQTIIGIQKQLSELEAQLRQFAVTAAGIAADLKSAAIVAMRTAINEVISAGVAGASFVTELAKKGITAIQDGAGLIYKDRLGNLLVDLSSGIGPQGTTLGLVADLQGTYENVKQYIEPPLSQNQILAIGSLSNSMGEQNFIKSNVLKALNDDNFGDVPRRMSGWVVGSSPGVAAGIQEDLVGRRAWEASLFQTPDSMDISAIMEEYNEGEATFQQLADQLDLARQAYFSNLQA